MPSKRYISDDNIRFMLVYHQNTKQLRVNWKATKVRLEAHYMDRFQSGDWSANETAIAIDGIDLEIRRVRHRYYRIRELKRKEIVYGTNRP